jgi:hypothetical protein
MVDSQDIANAFKIIILFFVILILIAITFWVFDLLGTVQHFSQWFWNLFK